MIKSHKIKFSVTMLSFLVLVKVNPIRRPFICNDISHTFFRREDTISNAAIYLYGLSPILIVSKFYYLKIVIGHNFISRYFYVKLFSFGKRFLALRSDYFGVGRIQLIYTANI